MDIYCPKCGEPWDTDTFHDIAQEQDITFDEAIALFRKNGCSATGWSKCNLTKRTIRGEAFTALSELLGDDIDGIASMLEDFDAVGLLD